MFKTRPCGCKGLRSCKICEREYGAWKIHENLSKENSYVFCPLCKKLWPGWDIDSYKQHPNHSGDPINVAGIEVILDFLTPEEEEKLIKDIDKVHWDLSQSGRYKQNYGPKCNFKKRKVSSKSFYGYPEFTKFIQERFKTIELLKSFETVEQCSLEYTLDRGSSIDPHIDDCWIWGERIPTLSLLSDSVLTLSKFTGPITKYNLADSLRYPRIISKEGKLKSLSDIQSELEMMSEVKPILDKEEIHENESVVLRIPMPRRSLIILFGEARYSWEHSIAREDIAERRVCITYRELTPPFLPFGPSSEAGKEILERSREFWSLDSVDNR